MFSTPSTQHFFQQENLQVAGKKSPTSVVRRAFGNISVNKTPAVPLRNIKSKDFVQPPVKKATEKVTESCSKQPLQIYEDPTDFINDETCFGYVDPKEDNLYIRDSQEMMENIKNHLYSMCNFRNLHTPPAVFADDESDFEFLELSESFMSNSCALEESFLQPIKHYASLDMPLPEINESL